MPCVYRTKLWQVTLPDAWRAGGGGPLVTIWNPEGVGTISVMSTEENEAPPRSRKGEEFSGKLIGRAFEHKTRDIFARHWDLLCGDRWIYVRYSCAAKNAALERAEVDEILRIFKGRPRPPVAWEFVLLREPGKDMSVRLDSAGYQDTTN